MFQRTLTLFVFGAAAVLCGATVTDAQPPGKGGFGKGGFGKGPGAEMQKLEAELSKLQEQVKDIQAQLEKSKKGGFEGREFGKGKGKEFGKGKDFGMWKGFEKKKEDFKKEMARGEHRGYGWGGFAKLDPATIKEKYEHYKKLYEESKAEPKGKGKAGFEGRGRGPGRESGSVEARLDRLTRELEELRSEIHGSSNKRKKF
jgi:hypothetical protein